MSVIDFPQSPTVGQQFDDWIWDGVKWTGMNPQGPPGSNAFSYVTVAFTIPAVGQLVTINVVQASWTQSGLCVFVGGMYAIVQSVASNALIVARLSENPETDDNITGAVVPPASLVSPSGFPGIGVPGTPGSSESSLWVPVAAASSGWNPIGWTVMARTILNLQSIQLKGQATPSPPITTNTLNLGNLPNGFPIPTENRFAPISCSASGSPGYSIAHVAITPAGGIVIVPNYAYGASQATINMIFFATTIPMDVNPS